jgi:hypothetical protein
MVWAGLDPGHTITECDIPDPVGLVLYGPVSADVPAMWAGDASRASRLVMMNTAIADSTRITVSGCGATRIPSAFLLAPAAASTPGGAACAQAVTSSSPSPPGVTKPG